MSSKAIPVYLFLGFLEAGKTQFIQETISNKRFGLDENILLVTCEEGIEEYDLSQFGGKSIKLHPLRKAAPVPGTGVTPGRLAPRYMLWQYSVTLHDTVHARETASDLIQATRLSDESIAPRYRQIMQEYLDKSGSESVPGQTGRPVSD